MKQQTLLLIQQARLLRLWSCCYAGTVSALCLLPEGCLAACTQPKLCLQRCKQERVGSPYIPSAMRRPAVLSLRDAVIRVVWTA
jgi:hypothetical protein